MRERRWPSCCSSHRAGLLAYQDKHACQHALFSVFLEPRFDAGLVALELERAGLGHLVQPWGDAVRQGFCTMDPDVGDWLRKFADLPEGPLALKSMVEEILPQGKELTREHHSAPADAYMTLLLYENLVARCGS